MDKVSESILFAEVRTVFTHCRFNVNENNVLEVSGSHCWSIDCKKNNKMHDYKKQKMHMSVGKSLC